MLIWLIIFLRIVANPLSNVFQKILTRRRSDPLFIICATHALISLLAAPLFLHTCRGLPTAYWINITLVAGLTVLGNVLIVEAVKRSDLSVLGPINAYKSVVSLVPGMVLLHEFPKPLGLGGIMLVLAGSYVVVDKNPEQPYRNVFVRFFDDRGVQYRLAALVVSATEAIFLKKALLASSALPVVAGWAFLGFGVSAVATLAILGGRIRFELRRLRLHYPSFGLLAVTTAVMQYCTIVSFGKMPVGYALALFQTSTLLTVLLGWRVFGESKVIKRLTGSVIMVAGAVLIILSR